MAYIELENLVDKSASSIYKLVIMASRRALEIAEGQPKLVGELNPALKPSTIALHEIQEGKVYCKKLKPKE